MKYTSLVLALHTCMCEHDSFNNAYLSLTMLDTRALLKRILYGIYVSGYIQADKEKKQQDRPQEISEGRGTFAFSEMLMVIAVKYSLVNCDYSDPSDEKRYVLVLLN